MSYQPVSGIVPQYSDDSNQLASGFYVKFYIANTTTPLSMATDSTGGTLLTKAKLNPDGLPISNPADNTTVFIPHVDQDYRLVIYRNEADANANNTAGAFLNVPKVEPLTGNTISTSTGTQTLAVALDDRVVRVGSVAEMEALSPSEGVVAYLSQKGRAGPFRFSSQNLVSKVTGDTYQGIFIAPNSDPTGASGAFVRQFGQAVQLDGGTVNPLWFGAEGSWDGIVDGGFDDTPHIEAALASGARSVEFLPTGAFYQMRSQITIDSTYEVETIKGLGGKIKVGNFTAVSTGTQIALFSITKSDVVVDGLYIDLNGLKNYDDQSGTLYYKWGPNVIQQATGVAVISSGTNVDNVVVKNCTMLDGDSAIQVKGNSYSGNPQDAGTNANLSTNIVVKNNIIKGDRGNAIYCSDGVLGVTIQDNLIMNSFYVSIRCYNSVADAIIIKNTVINNYSEMNPSTYETSTATDFSQPTNPNVGPRAGGIWYAKGSAGVGDSLGDAIVSKNVVRYIGHPTGASVSEKWITFNSNTNSLAPGAELVICDNVVQKPIRAGFICRSTGLGTKAGSKVVISKNTVIDSYFHGFELAITESVELMRNEVVGYDRSITGGNAINIRSADDCIVLGNFVSRGKSGTTSDHISMDTASVNTRVMETKFGDTVDFSRFTERSYVFPIIAPGVWTTLPGIDLTGGGLRFRVTVSNRTDGENQFASATFIQDEVAGSGFIIGQVDQDTTTWINLRVNAGVPEVFLFDAFGGASRRLNFDYVSTKAEVRS